MEQIEGAARKSLARLIESGAPPESDSERTLLAWSALVEIYGSAIEREYGLEPPRLWRETLSNLSDEELQRGFCSLVKEPRRFPPNLSEFVAACHKKATAVRFLGPQTSPAELRRLLPPKANPAVAAKHIANMRRHLKESQ